MRNQVFKKLFSVLLALIMVAGLLPASVLAEGEGNADSTPAPTEAVQPTESAEPTAPTETETPEVTEVPAPTPENPATTVEPAAEPTPAADPTEGITIAPVNEVAAQAATTDDMYVKKEGNGKRLEDETFYRIFLLDCGRKYFTVDEIKGIIDLLKANHYTHIELAFGNEGLRLLLNEKDTLSFKNNGVVVEKTGTQINEAIQYGNDQLDDVAGYEPGEKEEFTQAEMSDIISYAKGQGIGVIPLFNAPGHMYTVVKAMEKLGLNANSITVENAGGGKTANVAIDPTNADAVYFVKALMQKYVDYFSNEGCKFFNIGADESGINNSNYSAYAQLVNSHAAMVQNAGMVAMAFNDGIYNPAYISSLGGVEFDNNIVISYWTYSNYATAASLADKGFIINSTHNNWYYVLGKNNGEYFGYNNAINNMKTVKCNSVDSGYTTNNGCTLAVWCDYPGRSYSGENSSNVASLISTFAAQNPTYFKAEEVKVPAVEISENETNVKTTKETVDGKTVYKAAVKADGTSKIQLKVVNIDNTVNWASDNNEIATVDGNGLVTFKGAAGAVTITATPVTATRSINETAAYSITFNVTKEGEVPQIEKDITVVEGRTATDVIEGYNYSNGTYTTENATVATVESVIYEKVEGGLIEATSVTAGSSYYIKNSSGQYLTTTGAWNSDSTKAAEWTITTTNYSGYYYLKNGNSYLLYNDNAYTTTTYWYYANYYTISGTKLINYSNNNAELGTACIKGEAVDGTTITFKGVAEGDTIVTIGHVTYNVHVIKEDLTNVSPLPVQTWITNNVVESSESTTGNSYWAATWGRGTNNGNAYFVNLKPEDVYGKEGKSITECMPNDLNLFEFGGTYWKKAKDNKASKNLYVWRGLVHNTNSIQKIYGADYSNIGTEFNYIRYYGGKWEVSIDRTENSWIQVYGYNSISGNNVEQIAVYYMMRTEITTEVKTDVADWGYTKTDDKYSEQIGKKSYVILDFAVKIDGAELKPNNFPQDGKTFVFHCDENKGGVITSGNTRYRQLNNFRAVETLQEGYEVYMVTVTMTSGDSSNTISDTTSYSYDATTEQIIWAIDEETKVNSRLDEYTAITSGDTTYSGCKVGGDPYIRGIEVYNQHGALITYYIRYKAEEGKLTVRYFDATSGIENAKEFHNYSIGVKNIETDRFNQYIQLNVPDWKGDLLNGSVINKNGDTVTVSADLSTMSSIDPQYRYAKDYTCIQVDWKDEGKEVCLYYTFSSNVTYVVDFGIPLVIKPTDMSEELVNAKITSVTVDANTSYADITVNETDYSITYKLNKMINSADAIVVSYTGINKDNGNLGKVSYTVTIIPATNVYYEDSFAKFYGSDGKQQTQFNATGTDDTPGVWYIDGQEKTATQALEALGEKTNHNVYGYDPAYQDSTMFSMGSARKVTVTNDMAKDGVVWPTAQFTFKGTGFDIISLTDNTSGAIFVFVYKGTDTSATGTRERSHIVDNYYGYTQDENGNWVVNNNANNALYQIPVMRIRDLEYGEYTAVVKVFYDEGFNHTTKSEYSFWLDAVRVYDPMGKSETTGDTYGQDGEAYPQYIKLRSELKKLNSDGTASSGALFIDGKENANISEYANYGPNNEVYLANGQAITFKLEGNLNKIATVQIGAKAPNGNAKLVVNSKEVKELATATEMYYTIDRNSDNTFTISNTGSGILSLTNLKITYTEGNQTVSLGEVSAEHQTQAVQMVRALFAPAPVEPEPEPEPEKTFEPERFEASWTKNVMQGRKATLTVKTSEDVEAITVDGQTIRSYRTRTERVGFGRRAKRITYREFTYSMVAQESADFSVTAINAEGTESEAITARLTVKTRPNSMRDMWDWFKGWF